MKKSILLLFLMLASYSALANNISITSVSLTGQNTTDDYTMVNFDISWENSWRVSTGPSNWDAAWVFVKYRVSGGTWNHATLNSTGHTAPAGSIIAPASDGTGAFIYRDIDGSGTFSLTGVQLRWNYGTNGVADDATVDIQVFAIEMVYVPQGAFYAGDGTVTNIQGQFEAGTSGTAVQVSSEGAITLGGGGAGSLGNNNAYGMSTADDFNDATTQSLPAAFPKGYNAFYCMKYEISQQGYVDFLNNLTTTQANNRYPNKNGFYRHGISVSGGVYSTTLPYVACNYLSWMDGAAYSDWAGLRPMTELEFEKACRGNQTAVANEYAWGSISITQNTGITNSGLTNETSTNSGNCTYGNHANVPGPMRVGALATSSSSRSGSGATYYGIMEMSGNLWERTVTVGNATGRTFTGAHGNGSLSVNGHADVTAWPGLTSGEVTGATGSGLRGSQWYSITMYLRVSDRSFAVYTDTIRNYDWSFRAVRLVP